MSFIDNEGKQQHNNQNTYRRQEDFVKEPVHVFDFVNALLFLLGVLQTLTPLLHTFRLFLNFIIIHHYTDISMSIM